MKNWKRFLALMCTAAMVTMAAAPVYAEEAADPEVAEISESMLGLWQDSAGDIYGFYKDNSFMGQWKEEGEDVLGGYSLVSDGEVIALAMAIDEDNVVLYSVNANVEENILELYDENGEELLATLAPYEAASEEEALYNEVYQTMADNLTECFMGTTEAGETMVLADNDDGSFCAIIVVNQDDEYVSFVGPALFDEAQEMFTVTDAVSGLSLSFTFAGNDDGTISLDMGEHGSAVVEEAVIANAIQVLKYCIENGTEVA